jgi:hypothetical protein
MFRFFSLFFTTFFLGAAPVLAGLPSRFHEFAHIGDGGGLKTTFLILNQNALATEITLSFFTDNGTPWSLDIGGASQEVLVTTVPAGGMLRLATAGEAPTAQGGWARLVANQEVGAQALFEIRSGGSLVTQAAVESSGPLRRVDVFVGQASGSNTGIALASLSSVGRTRVRLELIGALGSIASTQFMTLGALEHKASFIFELFSGISQHSGTLRISASGPITVTTLQQTGLVLGTLPPISRVN